MSKPKFLTPSVILALAILSVSAAHAEIAIRIIDVPKTTLVYSPIYVTAEIKNNGDKAVTVPVGQNTDRGAFLEISTSNGHVDHPLDTFARTLFALTVISESIRTNRDPVEQLPRINPAQIQVPDSFRRFIVQFEKESQRPSGSKN